MTNSTGRWGVVGAVAGFTVGSHLLLFFFKELHYLIIGEDALACSPQKKCNREEEEGAPDWDQLQPCTRPAIDISPAQHDEDVCVVKR